MNKRKLEKYVRKAVRKNLPEELIMQKMVKAGFSEIDIHQAIKRADAEKKDKVSNKRGRWLYLIPILIPLIIIGYVVYMNWLPFGYEKNYVLDVGKSGDTNDNNQLYLRELETRISSPNVDKNGIDYREIHQTPIYFVLKAPIRINNNVKIGIKIITKNNIEWSYSFTDYDVYVWKKLDYDTIKENNEWVEISKEFENIPIVYKKDGQEYIIFALSSKDITSNNKIGYIEKIIVKIDYEKNNF